MTNDVYISQLRGRSPAGGFLGAFMSLVDTPQPCIRAPRFAAEHKTDEWKESARRVFHVFNMCPYEPVTSAGPGWSLGRIILPLDICLLVCIVYVELCPFNIYTLETYLFNDAFLFGFAHPLFLPNVKFVV